ncbi:MULTISPECIES: hypothetical protein [unclassified Caballeronia]|uniref:hypothetical protein n=1 Tax=unclassified Caballeronia TaxID=2646786 RepID=UPI00285AFB7D|nr:MULTISPECIES: hypothetical protein [unclassified Caballeronia]MDR5740817.1 hypothetical protein [Caballeronia sp. LZ016]MDR5808662.1 hypothetical protein [Caballeronia sp. LZ019]
MKDLAWNIFISVSFITAIAMLSCTVITYLDLWQFHGDARRHDEPLRFRLLRSTWFFYFNACTCLTSVAALLYVT